MSFSTGDMADAAQLVAQLVSWDRAARQAAARELYRRGRELGDAAVAAWLTDKELSPLLSGPPTVGVAVSPENFEKALELNGWPLLADVPPDLDAKEFELHCSEAVQLDILTTRDPEGSGAIARFLSRQGEGIQQVEYMTSNVDRATELLSSSFGLTPVYPTSRLGADGTRVNFFLVSTPNRKKVLIELVEAPGLVADF
jgi:hypothetical protein